MEITKIVSLIEEFAPLELQASWDYSGFQIYSKINEAKNVLICLSVTKDIINQAIEKNCDMIISHHPLFFVPFDFNKGIPIYSAHTNLDKTDGGTTDTLIEVLNFEDARITVPSIGENFLRLVTLENEISLEYFVNELKINLRLDNLKIANNRKKNKVTKLVFCAGSGMDFLNDVEKLKADIFVTGDVKYHQALESNVIIADIGHFESERPVLQKIRSLLENIGVEGIIADEKSPFINY